MIAFSVPAGAVAESAASPEERLATLVNQARSAQGLTVLAVNPELTKAAEAHGLDMIAKGYMEHESKADGASPQTRAQRAGYAAPTNSGWLVIETISARATAEQAVNFFLSHGQHRGVVLRPIWREMGVAFVSGGPYGQLWIVEFGCRPNVLPVLSESNALNTTLRITNEECNPFGGPEQMGRATQLMVSDKSSFEGGTWEPFAPSKTISSSDSPVYIKLRDSKGREATTKATTNAALMAAAGIRSAGESQSSFAISNPAPILQTPVRGTQEQEEQPPPPPSKPQSKPSGPVLINTNPPAIFAPGNILK